MGRWNPKKLNDSFKYMAKNNKDYFEEASEKARLTPNYRFPADEALARFYVYNHLHGRICLETREAFLKYLEGMTEFEPDATGQCFDTSWFRAAFIFEIKQLLKKYS